MGLSNSKIEKQLSDNEQEESLPSTPIITPKSKINELDPRSPSAHISRTPLEVTISEIRETTNPPIVRLLTAVSEKLGNLEEADSVVFHNQSPSRIEEKVIFGIDPRSPTIDFTRTPIILSTTGDDIPKKLHNKNLDKVRQATIFTPPKSTCSEKNTQVIPPKLLDSSPLKPRPANYKRKSLVGLLETNLDFTETNLDEVIKENCHVAYNSPSTKTVISVVDPRSPTIDFQRTPIQIIKDLETELNIKSEDDVEKALVEDNKSSENECDIESVIDQGIAEQIEQEENVIEIEEYAPNVPEDITGITESISTDAVEEPKAEIKSAPITPPNILTPLSPILPAKHAKSAPVTPPRVNITANLKELDKKLTNLIYEDEDIVVCPRIVKLKENIVRSPLKTCNTNEPVKPKLKVSDKPRKSDYAVSKIPVFRDKVRRGDIQCENTPPRNRDNKKVRARKSHWDNGDNTLYI